MLRYSLTGSTLSTILILSVTLPLLPSCGGAADEPMASGGQGGSRSEEIGASATGGRPTAQPSPVCGDGVIDDLEQCDDGNTSEADGCNRNCAWSIKQVVAGVTHTCALHGSGKVKCWGDNASGQLGLGDIDGRGDEPGEMGDQLEHIDLGSDRVATAISAGNSHTCAVLEDGAIKCWGTNIFGPLGLGDLESRGDGPNEMGDSLPSIDVGSDRVVVAISTGDHFTCALLDHGAIKCWGYNVDGQLGLGDISNRGDAPNEMGDALGTVDLGTNRATQVSGVGLSACALLENGLVTCWGNNAKGQLGLGTTAQLDSGPHGVSRDLAAVSLGTGRIAKTITAGGPHSCAILDDGTIKCWGYNGYGQLGLEDIKDRGRAVYEMGDSLPTVAVGTGRLATSLSLGDGYQSCALLDDATAKCWGYNGFGQLGLGDKRDRGDEPNEMGDSLPAIDVGSGGSIVQLAAGYGHVCALLANGSIKCWGDNQYGQLGLGDTENRGDDPNEMGNSLPEVSLW